MERTYAMLVGPFWSGLDGVHYFWLTGARRTELVAAAASARIELLLA